MADIKVGDEVRVLKHRNRYSSFPAEGYAGTVTKIARKYATATYTRQRTAYPAGPVEDTVEFDMQTGRVRDGSTNYDIYVQTAEQYERDQRLSAAIAALTARKIQLDFGHGLTLEQIEALAEVVKTFDGAG
jgi:hypothetical protein